MDPEAVELPGSAAERVVGRIRVSSAQRSLVLEPRRPPRLRKARRWRMRMPRGTSGLGEAMMLRRSVERLSGLVRLHGGSFACRGMARTSRGPSAIGRWPGGRAMPLPFENGVGVPAGRAAGGSTSFLVRRRLRSGGSVSSPVMAPRLGVRGRSASSTREHYGTTDDLLKSLGPHASACGRVRCLPAAYGRTARPTLRGRSRRSSARRASIPPARRTTHPARGLSTPSARLRTGVAVGFS